MSNNYKNSFTLPEEMTESEVETIIKEGGAVEMVATETLKIRMQEKKVDTGLHTAKVGLLYGCMVEMGMLKSELLTADKGVPMGFVTMTLSKVAKLEQRQLPPFLAAVMKAADVETVDQQINFAGNAMRGMLAAGLFVQPMMKRADEDIYIVNQCGEVVDLVLADVSEEDTKKAEQAALDARLSKAFKDDGAKQAMSSIVRLGISEQEIVGMSGMRMMMKGGKPYCDTIFEPMAKHALDKLSAEESAHKRKKPSIK
jgi:hypothetical protein